jgi:PAS domain-containing protein
MSSENHSLPQSTPESKSDAVFPVLGEEASAGRLAALALQQNEALFSTLIERSPGAVFALDDEMRFRQLNPQTAAVFSPFGDLIGRPFGEIMEIMWSTEVAREIIHIFRRTLATGERYISPDFYHRRADSSVDESCEWEIQRLRFPDGKFGVVCYFADVTADRALREALRTSKERFDIVRESAQVGFWFCDLPFDRLEWDDLVKAHFWLPPEVEVTIGTFYERLHPDDRERTRAAMEESIASKTRYDIEYRTVSPDGRGEKWIRAVGRTFYDAKEQPIRFDGVTLDITAQRRAELDARLLADVSQDLVGFSAVGEILQTVGTK